MREEKISCDVCGSGVPVKLTKEIGEFKFTENKPSKKGFHVFPETYHKYDLCSRCSRQILDFIRGLSEKARKEE